VRNVMKGLVGVIAFSAVAALFGACGDEDTAQPRAARCDVCGMRIDPSSGWRAGGQTEALAEVRFDTPKCLFRYHHQRGGVREPWVIEYYTQERRPARELLYVLGSDVQGPMGRDLVPVQGREAAERFARDHQGRVLGFDEVTAAVVDELFRPRARP
jgi:copper chaperone NosL